MRMAKFGAIVLILGMAVLALGFAFNAQLVPVAKASHGCSVKTLQGNYAGVWTGLLDLGPPPTSPQPITAFDPYDAMEVSTFDGAGNFSSTVTAAVGGTPAQTFPDTGTYTVSSNCTGSLTLASGLTFDFVIFHGGNEIRFAETDGSPTVVTETRMRAEEEN